MAVKVEMIMRKGVITASSEMSLSDAAKVMTNNKVGSIVIMKDNLPASIVTTEDIVGAVAAGQNLKKAKIKDLPKKKLVSVMPSDTILEVARKMVKTGYKRIPVIRGGKLEGIISDKEILATTPEMIDILSEKLKARVSDVASPSEVISGICENCESYSDNLKSVGGRWLCEECK